jgi:hypothetical protein
MELTLAVAILVFCAIVLVGHRCSKSNWRKKQELQEADEVKTRLEMERQTRLCSISDRDEVLILSEYRLD